MKVKLFAIAVSWILLLCLTNAETIYVFDNSSIQEAINKANTGDTIIVSGYHKENIVINKAVTLFGKNATIDGQKRGDVLKVLADGVKITGFQIVNCGNRKAGVYVKSSNNEIYENKILNNYIGVKIEGNNNVIKNNVIESNRYGLFLWLTKGNKIYLNNFDNFINVFSIGSKNIWNSTLIEYSYNGKMVEGYLGNYYSDYIGHDLNDDGIGDLPYVMGLDKDNYPLTRPFEMYFSASFEGKNNAPIADFVAPNSAYVNEVVKFDAKPSHDVDGKITKYIWKIDGKTFYGKVVNYSFSSPGLYTVELTVFDDKNASSSTTKSIRVLTKESSPAIMIVAPKVVTGETFKVSVVARNTTNLGAFMIKLSYSKNLQLVSVKAGSELPRYFTALRGDGYVKIISTFDNNKIDNGEIVKLTFKVKNKGIVKLDIKGIAATPDFDPINVEWIGAEVNVE